MMVEPTKMSNSYFENMTKNLQELGQFYKSYETLT